MNCQRIDRPGPEFARRASSWRTAAALACLLLCVVCAPAFAADCNNNGVDDLDDIADGTSQDCNDNNVPDECDIANGLLQDCNENGVPDVCDIQDGTSDDLNGNEIPDECEPDCNGNGVPDSFDIQSGYSEDCNFNGQPDECDIANGLSQDCNENGVPDFCDRQDGTSFDCNGNGVLDECDVAAGTSEDCNENVVPDECEPDCNNNDVPDDCDLANLTSFDCNGNGVPDECDIASGDATDCNGNGRPDSCDTIDPDEDCNLNNIPDICETLVLFELSPQLPNIGHNSPRSFVVPDAPESGGDVTLDLAAIGDFAAMVEYVNVELNGVYVGRVFEIGANDCPDLPDTDTLTVTAAEYNSVLTGGDLTIRMVASEAVNPMPILCDSYIQVSIEYQAVTDADQNGNGVLDECELGPCPADLTDASGGDPDGSVDVFDLIVLLSNWNTDGPGAGIAPPFNIADVFDLIDLLDAWGPCE